MTEVNAGASHRNENRPSDNSTSANEQREPAENSTSTSSAFINHAAISWEENRRQWAGDLSQRSQRMPKDPIISWSTTYEDLLLTSDPFPEAIPLSENIIRIDRIR